ncbi:hypothetical protein PIB30_010443 [Stylosanthes scabra]|uniref:Replication protein A 70 kDa DNA-binding subunit B/D first OB fold domain-containing protein n=1 Tax=Stylosanthes scabra TaxID=79078 RepID=A0ABU6Y3K5_9FABA|nr:hypothetical protein [Stylosanthes scabra]
MVERFDMLSDLHRRRLNWHFRVYVKRLYEHRYPGKNGFTLEMVLVDSDGVRVHASIPTSLVNRWLGNIKEFHMYDMKNFIVVERKH